MVDARPTAFARAGVVAWRLLGVGALVVASWWLARQLMPVLVPLVVAALLAALLQPFAARLRARGLAPSAAALAAVGLLVAAIAVIAALVVPPFVDRASELGANIEKGLREVAYTVAGDVANVERPAVDKAIDDAIQGVGSSRSDIAGGVLAGATALLQVLAATVLVLFLSFFLVKDGPQMGRWLTGLVSVQRRTEAEEIGARAWAALGTYARGVVFVATVDAVCIGVALLVIGVPLVVPLVVLTWIAAFFPIIGAFAAGAAAVLVALVEQGMGAAIAIAVVILLIQQLEGNVLYPSVVGPRLRLHPVAVLLAVTIGATVGGIPGAFLAVPVATVLAVVIDERRKRQTAVAELELAVT